MNAGDIGMLLGAGGAGGFFQWLIAKGTTRKEVHKTDQDFIKQGFELAVQVVTTQRDDALAQLKDVRRELAELHLEIVGLKLSHSFDPFPRWMVDLEGRYIFVNRCFEERFLDPRDLTRRDLIGKPHEVLWSPEVCAKIRLLDEAARSRPDGRARATLDVAGTEWTIYKFPVRVQGVIVAYAGYMMEIE